MALTVHSGPILGFGITQNSTGGVTGQVQDYNSQRGPSLFDLGYGLADPRVAYAYQPGGAVTETVWGMYDGRGLVDYVPPTLSTNAFVAATVVTTGVVGAFTLTAVSTGRGTYATTIIAPETGLSVSVTGIGSSGAVAALPFGSDGTVNLWNPANGAGRAISITTSSSGDLGTWSIAGRDVYGYKMTETIALSQGTTNSSGYTIVGQKAFKYISAISNCSTPVSTGVTIGISDTYGMPLYVAYTGQYLAINILATANASISAVATSTASFILAAPSTATMTSTTADVRGTYASTTASNNTVRLQLSVRPTANALNSVTYSDVSPLFGALQYSSV